MFFNKYHQRNNFQKLQQYGRSYASFLPPNAFAAHRGPGGKSGGKGKSKSKGRQNPRGKDGQLLKCHRCGSTEHLIRRCPFRENASNSSPPNALAMMSGRPNQNLQFYARAGDGSCVVGQSVGIPSGNHPQIKRSLTSIDDDLESLRSVASSRRRVESLASGSGSDKQKIDYGDNPEPPHPAPTLQEIQQTRLLKTSSTTETWTAFTTGTASHDVGNEGTIMTADARRSTNVIRGLSLGSTFFVPELLFRMLQMSHPILTNPVCCRLLIFVRRKRFRTPEFNMILQIKISRKRKRRQPEMPSHFNCPICFTPWAKDVLQVLVILTDNPTTHGGR